MNRRSLTAAAATAALALTLAACGSDDDTGADDGGTGDAGAGAEGGDFDAASVEADEELAALVPEDVREAGALTIGTDASYAPNEFLDEDGSTIVGFDIDLFTALANKLDLDVEFENGAFPSLIAGVTSDRYDAAVSSFTINEERLEQVTMVSYFNAGTQWAVASGNPEDVDPDAACGLTVAVQTGTVQADEDLPVRQEECGDDPIDVLPFDGQDQATQALVSGRAQAMLADSPVIAYAVQQTNGQIETAGDIYDSAPYGYVFSPDDTELADAFAAALESAAEDGTYDSVLDAWGLAEGGVTEFEVQP